MIKRLILLIVLLAVTVMLSIYTPRINLKSHYFDQLDAPVLNWLKQVPAIQIDVFALPDSHAGAWVTNFLKPLQRYWSNLVVNYLDPAAQPELVRDYGIHARGEMVVHYQDRHIVLNELSYESLFNGLTRLLNAPSGWTVVLDGFGSQSMSDEKPDGLGLWLQTLQNLNYPVAVLDWDNEIQLPSNVSVLIIPSPKQTLSNSALAWLQKQVQQGISLWWLTNPETVQNQANLSLMFDVLPIDEPTINRLTLNQYPHHAITAEFDYTTDWAGVLPFKTGAEPVLKTEAGDVFAAAETFNNSRLLVTGDSDFINNSWLASGGNRSLSLRMLDWLLHQDQRFNIPDLSQSQTGLYLQNTQVIVLSVIMLVVLPALWLLGALMLALKKRRQRKQIR